MCVPVIVNESHSQDEWVVQAARRRKWHSRGDGMGAGGAAILVRLSVCVCFVASKCEGFHKLRL